MLRLWLFFEIWNVNEHLIKSKCLSYNIIYSGKIDEEWKSWFKNTFQFSINYINKSILLLRKGVYPYGFMDDRENEL